MINSPCLIPAYWIRFRLLRRKYNFWMTLVITPLKLPFLSEIERSREQNRWMISASEIDYVRFYSFLNDLLW
jgi:hypothetical protein